MENRKISKTVKEPPRNMSDVRECRNKSILILISSDVQGRRKKVLKCLGTHSISEYSSFWEEFPFSNAYPLLDLHNDFSFELLHNIYLGVSKLIKEMASKRLMTRILNSRTEFKSVLDGLPDHINGVYHLLACM